MVVHILQVFEIKSLGSREEHQAYKPRGNKLKHGQFQVSTSTYGYAQYIRD